MGKSRVKILEVAAVDGTIYFLLLPLMNELKKSGYIVEASCARGDFFDKIEKEGFAVHNIYISRSLNVFKHINSIRKMAKLMRREKYDIVHVHTPIGAFVGRIAARFARVPIVIYTIHGFYFHENMNLFKSKIIIFIEKFLARWTTFAFSQSDEDTKLAVRDGIFPPDKIITIGNGVDMDFFKRDGFTQEELLTKKEELNIPSNATVVTCVARMNKEKGIFDLLKAAEIALNLDPSIHFLFVGGIFKGNEPNAISEGFLKDYFKKNSLYGKHFHFLGMQTNIKEILAMSDIFVLPSYREGMPRSIIEAMAMELPVIATNIRGSREEVVDGETGILVPVSDVNTLSNAIIKLAKDSKLRKAMGKKGRERAEEYFDETKVIENELEILNKLIKESTKLL